MLNALVDFISIIIHPLSKLLGRNQVRILTYHRVCNLPEIDDFTWLSVSAFAQQMAYLSENGFNIITLEQFIDYKDKNIEPPPKTLIITFDDGWRDNYVNALPLLEKYNFRASFFIATDYIDSDEVFSWLTLSKQSIMLSRENKAYWLPLSRQDILEMKARGASFGSHTKTHCSLSDVDESRAMEELRGSKDKLEEILSEPVRCFSYPFGDVAKSAKSLCQTAGYRAIVGGKVRGNTLKSDFLELRRITIYREDSFNKFKRNVEGAYDWCGYLQPPFRFILRIIFQR